MSISTPRDKNPANLDPDAKNKSSLTVTKTRSMPIDHSEMKSFSTTHTTKSNSSYTVIKSSSIPYTEFKSIWTTHTKRKSICMLAFKTSDFRPAFKNNVNFDHPHNQIKSYSIPRAEIKSIRTTLTKVKRTLMLIMKEVIFRQHTSSKSISATPKTTKSISSLH